MRGVVKVALIVLVLTAACAKSAAAGPFEDAAAAYSRSDYATAFRLFHLPAEQENVAAQLNLGDMYCNPKARATCSCR